MRRLISLGVLAVIFAAMAPAAADEQPTGSILVPSVGQTRVHRCATTVDPAGATQGVAGWHLPVTPGKLFTLKAESLPDVNDFDIGFYRSLNPCAEANATAAGHTNVFGDESGAVPGNATWAIITLYTGHPGARFFYSEFTPDDQPIPSVQDATSPVDRALTVVAVIDSGFSPYHSDFLTSYHPWNTDADTTNNVTFDDDPSTFIEGYPSGSTPINITIPSTTQQNISGLRTGADAAEWAKLKTSTASSPKMYRFPGTKVIGALNFSSGDFYNNNDSHGTRSAASAAGNVHGTCPECVFVLINGAGPAALTWASSQPWIDVITNSYGASVVGGYIRDNIYFGSPLNATKAGAESGQTIVFSAGNGFVNAFDVPMFTYWSSEKGPDWMITVGAVDPDAYQQYSGAGKPVDISSIGTRYPSTGGSTPTGTGAHSGTSNAAPVTAGTFAKVIQAGRQALGDLTETHAAGVVATGASTGCAVCPLNDGVLTRSEVQNVVFRNVAPSDLAVEADTVWPSTQFNYYYQGHGVIRGYADPAGFAAEQQRFINGLLTGSTLSRPVGETNWFVVDSKCRQKLWGSWNDGYFKGTDPVLDPAADPIAIAFNGWCSLAREETMREIGRATGLGI